MHDFKIYFPSRTSWCCSAQEQLPFPSLFQPFLQLSQPSWLLQLPFFLLFAVSSLESALLSLSSWLPFLLLFLFSSLLLLSSWLPSQPSHPSSLWREQGSSCWWHHTLQLQLALFFFALGILVMVLAARMLSNKFSSVPRTAILNPSQPW